MPINFPRFETVNYGNVMGDVEAIKNMRLRNQVLGTQAREQENIIANREKARQIRQQIEGMPAQIAELERQGLHDEAEQLRQSYLTTRIQSVQMIGAMREGIDASNYKDLRADLIASGAIDGSQMPVEYSEAWFRNKIRQERADITRLTRQWGEEGSVYAQDLLQQEGEILWEGKPYETPESRKARTGGDGEPWEMDAADTNSIRNASAELFGGFYDPITGRYSGLNREQQQQIASINEEASRIYREQQGRLGHTEAVAIAARRRGIPIDQLQQHGDPAGIR